MDVKQVLVLRSKYLDASGNPIGVPKGKLIAQGAHASVSILIDRIKMPRVRKLGSHADLEMDANLWQWIQTGQKKIAVSVSSEQELLSVYEAAKKAQLPVALIRDAGHTVFHGETTLTAVAIGPAESRRIDLITGNLKLL